MSSTTLRRSAIGDLVEEVSTWNPIRESGGTFRYIDIGSIDQGEKTIERSEHIPCSEAPSRARQILKAGDVLVSTVRPNLNAVARVPDDLDGATGSTGFCVLRPRVTQLDSTYLFHWVKTPGFISDMVRLATGASYPAVSDGIVKRSLIPLPILSEQQRLAAILDKADELRSKRRKTVARLLDLCGSIFVNMFGDPVANEKGWSVVSVADFVASFEGGKNIVSADEENGISRHRVLKVSAITSLDYRPTESKPVPDDYDPPKSHFVRAGDLLFSRANTSELVGATAYVFATPPNLLLPDKIWRFVWRSVDDIDPFFVWFMFQHPAFRHEIGKRATGTSGSMKNISQQKVFSMRAILPPVTAQRHFGRTVQSIADILAIQRESTIKLDKLFSSLQYRGFRGDL